jgi:2-oxoglutarate dehydrogenase E1 component
MMQSTVANVSNAELLDENYRKWKDDPLSIDPAWSAFFEGFELGCAQKPSVPDEAGPPSAKELPLQTRVDSLVYAYRTSGHSVALIDPLGKKRPENPLLDLSEFGFSEKDLDLPVASKFYLGGKRMRLGEMIDELRATYAGSIGAEFMHIQNARVRNWVRDRLESRVPGKEFDLPSQVMMLRQLREAESFEKFLHNRYLGQKRFSLEGCESLMVALDTILENCPRLGIREIVMGMAHRGRLTVLANFLRKSLEILFAEFSENFVPDLVCGDGDVKYHLGYSTTRRLPNGEEVGIRLAANPSHLEAVNAVVQGKARAVQRMLGDTAERKAVLPLLIHGDAAFAGQGVVAEVLNMSQLPGYQTGGTIHVIVNNQIGFTTLPADARSSAYASDVAKVIEAPILHVNGDDPTAVAFCGRLALDFRQQFRRDVVIDLYGYRRHGHNEGDEPAYTQPDLYSVIAKHPSVGNLFASRLIRAGLITAEQSEALADELEARMEAAFREVKEADANRNLTQFAGSTARFQPAYSHEPVETGVPEATLSSIARRVTEVAGSFEVVSKVKRLVLDRRRAAFGAGGPIDWAFAETLAFGSLLVEGTPVRLSGQDSRRGTFSQRHAALFHARTQEPFIPLNHIEEDQAKLCVYNSLLSEAAVLGFDYGYSLDFSEMLCLWEAQFGDFANGAQVVIDQFIASSESKWQRPSGIVLLLPHGYEGQGPEHSSGRVERFLQLCAEENLQVCNVTTPAQYFHLLRRQVRRPFRKPLIVMTPKSLLRSEVCVSTVNELVAGRFHEILPGATPEDPRGVGRVILCSGKVYYDLVAEWGRRGDGRSALVRVEQFYPLHEKALAEALAPFAASTPLVWCQEEPQNMGGWTFMEPRLRTLFGKEIAYAGRPASASPAVGALAVHKKEQRELVETAFGPSSGR